jgi:YHS domain-containing protein
MKINVRMLALAAVVITLGALAFAAGAPGDETAKDPVCGMSVKVQGAAHTAEHMGKTYYFCSADCKAAFVKDPGKYIGKEEAGAPAPKAMGCCPGCPMMAKMKMTMKMMPGHIPAAEAPGAAPEAPAPQAPPHAHEAPECPKMAAEAMPCCPMMAHGMAPMKMRHFRPMRHGEMALGMPMGPGPAGMADVTVENTADGVVVRITSKDPEAVKLIQKHWAMRKAALDAAAAPAPKPDEKKK